MDLDLCDNYILCVSEEGGLTNAAKKLDISQPALSMSINNLEKKLGYEIFNRKTKPISLTHEGEIYIEFLKKQRLLKLDCQKKIDDLHKAKNTKLTVGGPVIYINSIIIDAVSKLDAKYSDMEFDVVAASYPELIEQVISGEMDCFVNTSRKLPERFEKIPIKKEKIYLCIPKKWPINNKLRKYLVKPGEVGEYIDYKMISGLEVISLLPDLPLQKELDAFYKANNVELISNIRVNQVNTAVEIAKRGIGMVVATEEVLFSDRYKDAFCFYSMPENISNREIYIAYDKKRYLSKACLELISCLKG